MTNGDNLYHVDFFRRHLDEMRNPEVVMTAVDFYSHHHKRFSAVEYKVGSIDLATQLFRASYLDARNATYVAGPYERDCTNQICDLSAYHRRRRRDPPIQTDLALLELRKRGGCDFIHVTNCVEINLGRPTHRRDVLP